MDLNLWKKTDEIEKKLKEAEERGRLEEHARRILGRGEPTLPVALQLHADLQQHRVDTKFIQGSVKKDLCAAVESL